MTKPTIKIAVVSDIVCPWCYIGKRRLEGAIKQLAEEFTFDIAYYPFELNPGIPSDGLSQKDYLTEKFGGDEQYERLTQQVTNVAESEGLSFRFDKQQISPNTRNAHRLVIFSREDGKELEMVERLFKAYFTEGIDLSKKENLVELAVEVGLDRDKVRLFLDTDTGVAEVAMVEQEMQKMGVRGVPFYIINDKYAISGAQPADSFVEAFRNIGQQIVTSVDSCDVDSRNC